MQSDVCGLKAKNDVGFSIQTTLKKIAGRGTLRYAARRFTTASVIRGNSRFSFYLQFFRSIAMSSVIFVHGTGVRAAGYNQSFEKLLKGFSSFEPRPQLVQCLWGEKHGARAHNGYASIPDYDATSVPGEKEDSIVSWAVLYEDPFYELRLLELWKPPGVALPTTRANEACKRRLREIPPDGEIAAQVRKCGLGDVWAEALERLTASPEFTAALDFTNNLMTGEHRETVARALTAQAMVLRFPDEDVAVNGAERDALVEMLLTALGGRTRGWLGDRLKTMATKVAGRLTTYGAQRRGEFSEKNFAAVTDILLYQARGEDIRRFIIEAVERATPPVTLLGHSLGGIACVDVLIERARQEQPLSQVELLVTVGSQAPLLYEANALVSRKYSAEPLPDSFPPRWLNIYDPRDFLSYVARGVFHGPKITDKRVNNGQPFPHSHNSYWDNPEVFNAISKELPQ